MIKSTNVHSFTADTEARFVVADLDTLPDNIIHSDSVVFSISKPLLLFLAFIEGQLEFHVNKNLERLCYQTFYSLLSEQKLFTQLERRIREAIEYIEANITQQLPISQLAQVAYLSETQFKKSFKLQVGTTVAKYIVNLRMDKAKALLLHTDYPIHIVAEQVGYTDYTAFSRRFSAHFAMPPSKFMS
ncbi:AraC family transcriptional regulator [Paraglaciecola aquimarina]|uniref:AraC family transcriptional regulator n=1 Tax=Paraglaciecola aquimarina TaxID=1235557 RepID=A0ABU3SUJ5_9ALTE|nr:AraC family transcriptional regulator [Paraglaciecola aquimarina]MDU0353685.1 AraC family transcriptional regulator [Paraglaciecola aquimarina]